MAKIRLIVDAGEVNCPVCSTRVAAGHGHMCSDEGVLGARGETRDLSKPLGDRWNPYNPDGDNYPR